MLKKLPALQLNFKNDFSFDILRYNLSNKSKYYVIIKISYRELQKLLLSNHYKDIQLCHSWQECCITFGHLYHFWTRKNNFGTTLINVLSQDTVDLNTQEFGWTELI